MITTEVFVEGPAEFTSCGEYKGTRLIETNEELPQAVAERIMTYALQRVNSAGLSVIIHDWEAVVGGFMNPNREAFDSYYVTWTSPEETEISLNRILLDGDTGEVLVDHGLTLHER
jgi:hypothetical protein